MDLIKTIKEKAKNNPKSLVFPESLDLRILKASEQINREGFAKEVILIGNEEEVSKLAEENRIALSGTRIINPKTSEKLNEFAGIYYGLRKGKEEDLTQVKAKEKMEDPLFFGTAMVKTEAANAMVAGAVNTTSNVMRASIRLLDKTSSTGIASSCFIMIVPDCKYGENGIFAFADAGVVPSPSSRQLADIAISTAGLFRAITGAEPKVAMLSFSTKGSANHRMANRVIEAAAIAKELDPNIKIDGELQADAALVPFVAEKKAPDSSVAGHANVLIFPDLNSGNIAYKLVERLAKAKAYGPLIQGVNKPISDLSRGCSTEDIIDISAITLLRSAEENK